MILPEKHTNSADFSGIVIFPPNGPVSDIEYSTPTEPLTGVIRTLLRYS